MKNRKWNRLVLWPRCVTSGPVMARREYSKLLVDIETSIVTVLRAYGDGGVGLLRHYPGTKSRAIIGLAIWLHIRCRAAMKAAGSDVPVGWDGPPAGANIEALGDGPVRGGILTWWDGPFERL